MAYNVHKKLQMRRTSTSCKGLLAVFGAVLAQNGGLHWLHRDVAGYSDLHVHHNTVASPHHHTHAHIAEQEGKKKQVETYLVKHLEMIIRQILCYN